MPTLRVRENISSILSGEKATAVQAIDDCDVRNDYAGEQAGLTCW
jgi:hypothetical protein